jgi:hypothetical protein
MQKMQKALRIVAVAIALPWAASTAYAQTPAPAPQPRREMPPIPKLNLTLEQRHTIKEFVKDVKEQATTRDVQPTIGDAIPQDISPQPMPAVVGQKIPQVKTHRFFVTEGEIVLVDPNNKVADIIKLTDN